MEKLSLKLLGPFQATLEGKEISGFRLTKVQALLIYLAVEQSAQSREVLMELLWPGMPERSARQNLRQILYHLRSAVSDLPTVTNKPETINPLILANRQTIQLNPTAETEVDVLLLESLINGTLSHEHTDLLFCRNCSEDLEKAVEIYRGDFLADFYLEDSNEFENWAQVNRERYRRKVLDALEILATMRTRQQEYSQARDYAEQQIDIDNLREGAYRQLMEVLALSGHREEAMAVYEKCRRILAEELSMAPAKRTTEIYEQIMAGDLSFESPIAHGVRGYELREEIGKGAYGVIHRGIQSGIDREVAVKVIRRKYANDPEFIRRFEAEAQTIAHLEHPFIVPLYDYWRDPDGAFLVMRYLRGGSLLTALERGPWEIEKVAKMLDQIASALSAAHNRGVIHRDIKPANIILDETGNTFLSDFGIARELTQNAKLTAEGAIVGSPDYISPEQIRNEQISPQTDIYSLGSVLYEAITGEKPFPDTSLANLLYKHLNDPIPTIRESRPDLPVQIDMVIQQATAKLPQDRFADPLEMAAAFRTALRQEEIEIDDDELISISETDIYNPYKGLRAFQEFDADDFFGREALTARLLDRLAESRFLAVIGPSGSGKSSVVKAGIIPALRDGAISEDNSLVSSQKWFVTEMVPGTHPLEELELALWPIAVNPPPSLVEPMQRDTRGLLRTIRRILPDEQQAQLLLVIDQFEELFTLVDETRRDFFIDSLLQALSSPRSPLHVIITLRADFYDRPLQYESLGRLLKENTEVVLPLTNEELTWAVREPARRVGVSFEPGLEDAIVADVSDQPGSLPLLQYSLAELFEKRQGRLMTRATYKEIGGVRSALGRRANEIYYELDDMGQEIARQLFLRLITLGEGVEDTRRRVLRSELEGLQGPDKLSLRKSTDGETATPIPQLPAREEPLNRASIQSASPDSIAAIIDVYGSARLLTFDLDPGSREPTVEVAHEALLREWDQLRTWLDESRNDIRLQRMLSQAAEEWRDSGCDDSYLIRGSRLDQFEGWIEESSVALNEEEQAFLTASLAARESRQAEEEARRIRELETARKLAESEQAKATAERQRAEHEAKAAKRLRSRAYVLAGVLVLAILLAIVAFSFARQSSQNAAVAEQNAMQASEQQALAATRAAEAETEAERRATAQSQAEIERQRAEEQREVAFAAEAQAELEAEQRALAQTQAENEARVAFSRELSAAALSNLSDDPERSILLALQGMAISHTVAAENALHQAILSSHVRRTDRAPDPGQLYYLRSSPDGNYLFSSGEFGGHLWDVNSGEILFERDIDGWIGESDFTPDSNLLILAYEEYADPAEGKVAIVDVNSGEELFSFNTSDSGVRFLTLSPDGQTLATGSANGLVSLWNWPATLAEEMGQLILTAPIERGSVWGLSFNHDSSQLAVANHDGSATVLDTLSGQEILSVSDEIPQILVRAIFSPDGKYLLTAGTSGIVQVWDLESGQLASSTAAHSTIGDLDFGPDGQTIVTVSGDAEAKLWRFSVSGLQEIMTLAGHTARMRAAEINPDGSQLVTSSADGTIRYWDVSPFGNEELPPFIGHESRVTDVDISADGSRLVSASNDGTAIVWDLSSGRRLIAFSEQTGRVNSADFSPSGDLLATGSEDTSVFIWHAESGELLTKLEGHVEGNVGNFFQGVIDVQFSPDGERVASAAADGWVKVWDVNSGAELFGIQGHPEGYGVMRVAFSPDGSLLATGTDDLFDDAMVKVWDARTGQELYTVDENRIRIWGVTFSQDGKRLAISDRSGIVNMWELPPHDNESAANPPQAKELFSVPAHSSSTFGLLFTPDGKQIVSTASDGKLSFLDSWTGKSLLTIDRPYGLGETAFGPGAKWLAAAGTDGQVYFFVLDLDTLLSLAHSRVTRSLTTAECQQFLHMAECPES